MYGLNLAKLESETHVVETNDQSLESHKGFDVVHFLLVLFMKTIHASVPSSLILASYSLVDNEFKLRTMC